MTWLTVLSWAKGALTWLKANWRLASAATGAMLVVGFILMALHWRADAERQREAAEQAKREAAGAHRATDSLERHSAVVGSVNNSVEREVNVVRQLPDADRPLDPARRAALCAGLERLRNDKRACNP
jgi:flagellar biosynthesis/type III secretory pathway M-ring protein FliF/YscJ